MVAAGCLTFVVLIVLFTLGNSYPWIWAIVAAAILAGVAARLVQNRNNKIASIEAFERQAAAVDAFANQIATGTGQSAAKQRGNATGRRPTAGTLRRTFTTSTPDKMDTVSGVTSRCSLTM